jgi:hypothetical protein
MLYACQYDIIVPDRDENDAGADPTTDNQANTDRGACAPDGTTPLVCQDFETELTASVETIDGEVTITQEPLFQGAGSLKTEVTKVAGYAHIVDRFAPIESGTIFFRAHLFVPIGNTVGTTKVINLSARGNPEIEQGVDINISGQRSIDIYQHGNASRFVSAPGMVPEGEWFCLRGSYTISDTAGTTSVWINDNLAVSTTASPESIINGGVSEFRTGIGWIEMGQETSVVYFDNVLVDTVPVQCSP